MDEVAGQFLTLAFVPADVPALWRRLRAVPPVRYLEAMAGELGRPRAVGRAGHHAGRIFAALYAALVLAAGEICLSDDEVDQLAEQVLARCRAKKPKKLMLATAESCTGGMIAAALTGIAGSSDVMERGFVTYSNAAKTELLGVPKALIAAHGAVSAEVASAMASGALRVCARRSRRRCHRHRRTRAAARQRSRSGSSISGLRGAGKYRAPSIISFPATARRSAARRCCARWNCCCSRRRDNLPTRRLPPAPPRA